MVAGVKHMYGQGMVRIRAYKRHKNANNIPYYYKYTTARITTYVTTSLHVNLLHITWCSTTRVAIHPINCVICFIGICGQGEGAAWCEVRRVKQNKCNHIHVENAASPASRDKWEISLAYDVPCANKTRCWMSCRLLEGAVVAATRSTNTLLCGVTRGTLCGATRGTLYRTTRLGDTLYRTRRRVACLGDIGGVLVEGK